MQLKCYRAALACEVLGLIHSVAGETYLGILSKVTATSLIKQCLESWLRFQKA